MTWTPPNAEYPPPKPGEPPMFAAARTGDHDTIRRLVAGGADLEQVFNIELDPGGRDTPATPLMVAAGSGDGATKETVELLLELGADPTRVVESNSAASMAAEGLGWNYRPGGDAARLRLLLDRQAPLPQDPSRRNRLLCHTAETGDAARLDVLLQAGFSAKGHWDPEEGRARNEAMKESMRRTAESEEFLAKMPEGVRELIGDPMESMAELFDSMAESPSDLEIPLFCAARSGSDACIRLLLEHGADPMRRDSSRRTAMYSATSTQSVRTLLDAGVPIEDSDELGWSPLVNALSDGEEGLPAIRALLDCGADANATHDHGYTVFMSAVGSNRCPETLRLLIAAGADPHAVTEFGYNAFHAALDPNGEANEEHSVRDTLGYLREFGVDIEHRNKDGQTPLALAIEHGYGIEVHVLCELGADPNARCPIRVCAEEACEWVEGPLLIAAATAAVDSDEKVIAMLAAGADPLVRDGDGFTALQQVVARVCQDAEDYEAAFDRFYKGLHGLRMPGWDVPPGRGAFLEMVRPILREYAARFAADIPIPPASQFEEQWRVERLACIEHLAAHGAWARRGPPLP
ncbi:MAG: ankyrin repeat domain-containing protein [Phycisphaerales bacterium JB060]